MVVMAAAVEPEMVPPRTVPAPGMSFMRLELIALPASVAPEVPSMAEAKVTMMLLFTSRPKIAVMEPIMAIWVGMSSALSAKGIGMNPSPNAAEVAAATAVLA